MANHDHLKNTNLFQPVFAPLSAAVLHSNVHPGARWISSCTNDHNDHRSTYLPQAFCQVGSILQCCAATLAKRATTNGMGCISQYTLIFSRDNWRTKTKNSFSNVKLQQKLYGLLQKAMSCCWPTTLKTF